MNDPIRRRILLRVAALPMLAVLPLLPKDAAARAGSGAKADFHYQDHPNEGSRCANCAAFIPPNKDGEPGQCRILAGPISPNGWCMAFSEK
jgi:hypothetical protein